MALKRKYLKKAVSIGLIFSMALGLAACNKKEDENAGKENAGLAKEYVFSQTDIDLSVLGDAGNYNIRNIKKIDDKIYMVANVYTYTESGSKSSMKILSIKEDCSVEKAVELLTPDTESSKEPDAQDDASKQEGGDEGAQTEEAVEDVADNEMAEKYPGGSTRSEWIGYQATTITDDGLIYVIKRHDINDWTDEENPVSESTSSICCWDMEGNFKWESPIGELHTEDNYYYIDNLVPLKNGTVAVLISGDDKSKIIVDKEGKLSERIPLKANDTAAFENINATMVKNDGTMLVTYYNQDYTAMFAVTYDLDTDTIGEEVKLPGNFGTMGYNAMTTGVDSDIVFANMSGVYSYTLGDSEIKQVMSYINSDLGIDSFNEMVMIDERNFIATYYDNINYDLCCGMFTKVDPKDIPDKKVLVLGGNWIDNELKNRVVEYNKESQEYRITIKDYQMYNTMDDYNASYTQLNNDILSGHMPDILVVDNWGTSIENYVSKGVLADIGALIEKDEELSQKEFMTNVFDAYKVNGKLYQVIHSFSVQTIMAKKSIVGDRTSWTMKDLEELMATMPEGTVAFGEEMQSGFLWNMLRYCGNDFVDVANGKCNFNSQQFIDMLEYANSLPKETSEDTYEGDWWMRYQSQYRENRTILMNSYISSFNSLNNTINGSFGEDVSCIGFPTDNGMGSFISSNGNYVLSAKSKNLDGAWDFIRYYLTDEYQKELRWALPVSKEIFMEKSKEALEREYYIDEDGKKVEVDEWYEVNGESIKIEPLTQKQLDEIVSFIQSVTKREYYNQDIQNIVTEEAEAFFAGQKSAKDVAGIIQSRAQLYVNENR